MGARTQGRAWICKATRGREEAPRGHFRVAPSRTRGGRELWADKQDRHKAYGAVWGMAEILNDCKVADDGEQPREAGPALWGCSVAHSGAWTQPVGYGVLKDPFTSMSSEPQVLGREWPEGAKRVATQSLNHRWPEPASPSTRLFLHLPSQRLFWLFQQQSSMNSLVSR